MNTIFVKYGPPTFQHNTLSLHFHYNTVYIYNSLIL